MRLPVCLNRSPEVAQNSVARACHEGMSQKAVHVRREFLRVFENVVYFPFALLQCTRMRHLTAKYIFHGRKLVCQNSREHFSPLGGDLSVEQFLRKGIIFNVKKFVAAYDI
jgi:hypothetical protein